MRAGFVGIIGLPNAGKSSLMNHLIESRVSIVTPKPQTTRRRVLGIKSSNDYQIVFVDAPGVLKNQKGLNRFLEQEALSVIQDSDALLAVISLDTETREQAAEILDLCAQSKKPWVLVISKVDLVKHFSRKKAIQGLAEGRKGLVKILDFSTDWKSEGKEEIFETLVPFLPASEKPLYDLELFTPHTVRELSVEVVREKCMEILEKEIPFQMAVSLRKFEERKGKKPEIYMDLIVAKDSHKPIVIGRGGQIIKKIGMKARQEIESLMDESVVLKLEVVVKENWSENKNMMKDLGYVVE
ncbi:MAG: GTPase Era [Proteobacteria bacterium]|jgi:GTP-binding protein Era|nr:GTPase Era [Pseudomonadota bacterium]